MNRNHKNVAGLMILLWDDESERVRGLIIISLNNMNKYEIKGIVGEGAYGIVYQARHKETGEIGKLPPSLPFASAMVITLTAPLYPGRFVKGRWSLNLNFFTEQILSNRMMPTMHASIWKTVHHSEHNLQCISLSVVLVISLIPTRFAYWLLAFSTSHTRQFIG